MTMWRGIDELYLSEYPPTATDRVFYGYHQQLAKAHWATGDRAFWEYDNPSPDAQSLVPQETEHPQTPATELIDFLAEIEGNQ